MKKRSAATIVFICLLAWNGFIFLLGLLLGKLHSPIAELLIRIGASCFAILLIVFILLKWVFKIIE